MGARGVSCVFRQICRTLLEKGTKESLEDIEGAGQIEEESPRLAVVDTARAICRVRSRRLLCPTYLSVIFVRHTNVSILSAYCS